MNNERKSVAVKFTEQQNQAIESWMTETSCSRQVAIIGLLVKGAKEMGVWDDEPRERASHSVRLHNTNTCSTYDEGVTRRVSATSETVRISEEEEEKEEKEKDNFSEFWYSIPKQFKRGTREEAKRKWNSKKVSRELTSSGLSPGDVADRYAAYFKLSKGEGYEGIRYVKHVSNWLDAFGFHDESLTRDELSEKNHVDLDLT